MRDGVYLRTVGFGARRGWLAVAADGARGALRATISASLSGALMTVVARLRRLFDLDAQPAAIAAHLARDPRLAPHVRARPGLRVAGAFDPFEAAARAVLGQQVSVAAARTIAGRLVAALGEAVATPARRADARVSAGGRRRPRGRPRRWRRRWGFRRGARRRCTRSRARSPAASSRSTPRSSPRGSIEQIVALPGVGPWTAHYLAMRAVGWPDAFPEGDLGAAQGAGRHLGRGGARARRAVAPVAGLRRNPPVDIGGTQP